MCSSSVSDPHLTPEKDTVTQWDDEDYSAYVFQETVYLNFDIGVVWVVGLPFKMIGAVLKSTGSKSKKEKEPKEKKSKVKKRQEDTPCSEYSREEIEAYLDEIYGDDD